jgi:hypothetical protein
MLQLKEAQDVIPEPLSLVLHGGVLVTYFLAGVTQFGKKALAAIFAI